jgi:hypothetical protein
MLDLLGVAGSVCSNDDFEDADSPLREAEDEEKARDNKDNELDRHFLESEFGETIFSESLEWPTTSGNEQKPKWTKDGHQFIVLLLRFTRLAAKRNKEIQFSLALAPTFSTFPIAQKLTRVFY